jgi:hypothetical protein
MGRQRVICRLGGDGDGGGRSTRWGVRSKIGEGVVGIDSEELELYFVKCREAGVELRLKKIRVRSEDVGWRVKWKEIEALLLLLGVVRGVGLKASVLEVRLRIRHDAKNAAGSIKRKL